MSRREAAIERAKERGWRVAEPGWREAFLALARKAERSQSFKGEARAVKEFFESHDPEPALWRGRIQGLKEGWGHPVAVLDVLLRPRTGKNAMAQWIGLWWRFDATEVVDLCVYKMDAAGRMMLAVGEAMHDKAELEAAENA